MNIGFERRAVTRVGGERRAAVTTRDEHGSSATGVGNASALHPRLRRRWIAAAVKLTIGISTVVVSSAHLPVSDATARRISSRFSSHIG